MKIGIIADIHNNIVALKMVLKKFQDEHCEGIICCGDIIGIGPYPEETISEINEIPNMLACVKGNHERYLTEGMPSEVPNDEHMDADEIEHHKWEHSLLSAKSINFISNMQNEEWLTIKNKRIYVSHYAIDENNRYFDGILIPSLDELQQLFEYVDADVVLYGHDHIKSIQRGDKYFINCGSLGCPAKEKNIAHAGILTIEEDISFAEISIEYDVAKVLEEMDRLNYPAKDTIKKIFYGV